MSLLERDCASFVLRRPKNTRTSPISSTAAARSRSQGEERELIPSDRCVATYDLAPAMRAQAITGAALEAIASGRYDVIVMNYANADMVGHTGKWEATIAAVEVLDACSRDTCLRRCCARAACSRSPPITETPKRSSTKRNNPITAHTTNPVPFVLVAKNLHGTLAGGGKLGDVAPTLLHLMGLPTPKEMNGSDLLRT